MKTSTRPTPNALDVSQRDVEYTRFGNVQGNKLSRKLNALCTHMRMNGFFKIKHKFDSRHNQQKQAERLGPFWGESKRK